MLLFSLLHSLQLRSTKHFRELRNTVNHMVNGSQDSHDEDGRMI